MNSVYARPLKVSTPEGKRIYAKIFRLGENIKIEINYLDIVKKDDPPFSVNGVIRMRVPIKKYKDTINLLTKYLEDLFLKGMSDEDTYSSLGAKPKSGRTKKIDTGGKINGFKGKGDTSSVYSSTRGIKSSKSSRGGDANPKMAKSSNPDNIGKD